MSASLGAGSRSAPQHPPSYPHLNTPPPCFFFQKELTYPFRRVLVLPAPAPADSTGTATTTAAPAISTAPGAAAYTIKLHGQRTFGGSNTPLLTLYLGDIGDPPTVSDAEKVDGNVLATARLDGGGGGGGGGFIGKLLRGKQTHVAEVKMYSKAGVEVVKVEDAPSAAGAGTATKGKEKDRKQDKDNVGKREVLVVDVRGKRLEVVVERKLEDIVMIDGERGIEGEETTPVSGGEVKSPLGPSDAETHSSASPGSRPGPSASSTWKSTLHDIRTADPVLRTRCITITINYQNTSTASTSDPSHSTSPSSSLLARYHDFIPSMKRYTRDMRWKGDHKGILEFARPEEDDAVRSVIVAVVGTLLEREKVKSGKERMVWSNVGAGGAGGCGGGG